MPAVYPIHLRSILRASKSRTQPAAFSMSEPRRGPGYAMPTGTDTPVLWDVAFRFTTAEALVFQLWFRNTIQRGVLPFTLPIRTEFGLLDHECRFLPDSLLPAHEDGETWGYTATIRARAQVVPDGYDDATDLIVALPDWSGWAGLLDQAVSQAMPAG